MLSKLSHCAGRFDTFTSKRISVGVIRSRCKLATFCFYRWKIESTPAGKLVVSCVLYEQCSLQQRDKISTAGSKSIHLPIHFGNSLCVAIGSSKSLRRFRFDEHIILWTKVIRENFYNKFRLREKTKVEVRRHFEFNEELIMYNAQTMLLQRLITQPLSLTW